MSDDETSDEHPILATQSNDQFTNKDDNWTTVENAIKRGAILRDGKYKQLSTLEPESSGFRVVYHGSDTQKHKIKPRRKYEPRKKYKPCKVILSEDYKKFCKKKSKAGCPLRIEELAVPTKRLCLDTWRTKVHLLPPVMVLRLKKLLLDETPKVPLADAFRYFKARKIKKKTGNAKNLLVRVENSKNKKKILKKIKHEHWDLNLLGGVFGYKIMCKLMKPLNLALTPEFLPLCHVVNSEIKKLLMKSKYRECKFTRNYKLQEEIAKTITLWIRQVLVDADYQLLLDDVKDLAEKDGHIFDLIDDLFESAFELACLASTSADDNQIVDYRNSNNQSPIEKTDDESEENIFNEENESNTETKLNENEFNQDNGLNEENESNTETKLNENEFNQDNGLNEEYESNTETKLNENEFNQDHGLNEENESNTETKLNENEFNQDNGLNEENESNTETKLNENKFNQDNGLNGENELSEENEFNAGTELNKENEEDNQFKEDITPDMTENVAISNNNETKIVEENSQNETTEQDYETHEEISSQNGNINLMDSEIENQEIAKNDYVRDSQEMMQEIGENNDTYENLEDNSNVEENSYENTERTAELNQNDLSGEQGQANEETHSQKPEEADDDVSDAFKIDNELSKIENKNVTFKSSSVLDHEHLMKLSDNDPKSAIEWLQEFKNNDFKTLDNSSLYNVNQDDIAPPNFNLLYSADEKWPENISTTKTNLVKTVSKSVIILGNLIESEESSNKQYSIDGSTLENTTNNILIDDTSSPTVIDLTDDILITKLDLNDDGDIIILTDDSLARNGLIKDNRTEIDLNEESCISIDIAEKQYQINKDLIKTNDALKFQQAQKHPKINSKENDSICIKPNEINNDINHPEVSEKEDYGQTISTKETKVKSGYDEKTNEKIAKPSNLKFDYKVNMDAAPFWVLEANGKIKNLKENAFEWCDTLLDTAEKLSQWNDWLMNTCDDLLVLKKAKCKSECHVMAWKKFSNHLENSLTNWTSFSRLCDKKLKEIERKNKRCKCHCRNKMERKKVFLNL